MTLHYVPDGGPSAPLFSMLAEALVEAGHEVTVIAGTPHYPSGRTLDGWKMPPDAVEYQRGVRVFRVPIPSGDRSDLRFRSWQFAAFQVGAAARIWSEGPFDAAVFANPALQVWLPWQVARLRVQGPLVFSIHDVYPDVGTRLGIFKPGLMDRVVGALESHCVRTADQVRILAPAFAEPARRLGARDERMPLIYDWTDTRFIGPLPRENSVRAEFGLDGKFVFMYAGNIGLSQGLEMVIEAAAALRYDPRVRFAFVGGGAGLAPLQEKARADQATNVVFIPFQPRARLPEVLAAADVSLITLRAGLTDSLPSKVYSIMASARPVLASVDPRNDVVDVIARAGCGVCVTPGDVEALVAGCRRFLAMPAAEPEAMGTAGRAYVDAHHSPRSAAAQFLRIFGAG